MDKQVIFVIAVAVGSMVGFSGFFISPSAPTAPNERPLYSPDDIRFKYQQADLKKPKRPKQTASSSVPEFSKSGKPSPTTTTSARGSDDSSEDSNDDPNEEPSITDHEPQEEPDLN
jgi:hypothetical protein